jgi:polyphenol oxidase
MFTPPFSFLMPSIMSGPIHHFASLSAQKDFRHAFTLRHPSALVSLERHEAVAALADWHHEVATELGFDRFATSEQVHGSEIAVVESSDFAPIPGVDGLVSNVPGVLLGVFVADCCAVYFLDPRTRAFGIVHSGKKGTEANITGKAVRLMCDRFGSDPADIIVQLSPCIRPPAYEVDFAADIREQAAGAGVPLAQIYDEGICTSSDLSRFYSYRMEKGKTGRMLALLGRLGQ